MTVSSAPYRFNVFEQNFLGGGGGAERRGRKERNPRTNRGQVSQCQTHTHKGNLLCSLCAAETQAVIPSSHSVLTELHIYTSLALCLLPSSHPLWFPYTFLGDYTLHLICQHCAAPGAGTVPAEDFITGMRSRFGRCFLWGDILLRGATAATLCWQPDLCPCWEIPQHSWKHCRRDWELCFGTPEASKTPWERRLHGFPNSTGLQGS